MNRQKWIGIDSDLPPAFGQFTPYINEYNKYIVEHTPVWCRYLLS